MSRAVSVSVGEVYDRDSRTKFEDEMKRFDAIVIGGAGRVFALVEEYGRGPVRANP
jgi:hypothetical protein